MNDLMTKIKLQYIFNSAALKTAEISWVHINTNMAGISVQQDEPPSRG
jgi:hypothetical protein